MYLECSNPSCKNTFLSDRLEYESCPLCGCKQLKRVDKINKHYKVIRKRSPKLTTNYKV